MRLRSAAGQAVLPKFCPFPCTSNPHVRTRFLMQLLLCLLDAISLTHDPCVTGRPMWGPTQGVVSLGEAAPLCEQGQFLGRRDAEGSAPAL